MVTVEEILADAVAFMRGDSPPGYHAGIYRRAAMAYLARAPGETCGAERLARDETLVVLWGAARRALRLALTEL